jgi:hypothetical protein
MSGEAHTNGNGSGHLSSARLRALQAHAAMLRQIAGEAKPYKPRLVSKPELEAWAGAVEELLAAVGERSGT